MKWLIGLAAVIGFLPTWIGIAWLHAEFTQADHRYRLTYVIDTPDGPRTASAVMGATRRDSAWYPLSGIAKTTFAHRLAGDAVYIDLGNGKHVIAILGHGATGGSGDSMTSLWTQAHGYYGWEEHVWGSSKLLPGIVTLKPPLIPTLVTFIDINEPASARVVYATGTRNLAPIPGTGAFKTEPAVLVDRIAETFGPGYAFHSASIEMVPASTPVTRGIEGRLPVIMGKLRELDKTMQISRPTDPFKVGSGHLSIQ